MRPSMLAAAAGLILANAFFVWAEFALVAARRTRLEEQAEAGGRRARVALGSIRELDFVLAGAQLGITMASLALGFVGEPAVAHLLEGPFEPLPEGLAHGLEVGVSLAIVVALHMVLGEMVPKNLAIAEPDRSALWVALPFRAYTLVFRPVIWALNTVANRLVRAMGVEPASEVTIAHSAAEISNILELSRHEGAIDPFEHRLLSRALGLGRLDARAVMVPRPDVVAVPETATAAEVQRLMHDTGRSRVPVYRGDLDDVLGFVHVKDLLRVPAEATGGPLPHALIRDMAVVPESRPLPELFAEMRRNRRHFALVVDEHGGTSGVVALEDVLEELVGDIRDEHDVGEGKVWGVGPRRTLVDAGLRPDEMERAVGLAIPEGDYDTVAGYVLTALGRVPVPGDSLELGGWVIRVRRMDGRRVDLLEITAPEGSPDGGGAAAAP